MTLPVFENDIQALIPQRPPIVMIDGLRAADDTTAETTLTVREANIFVRDGHMQEPGILEHIAQSAAAYLGYQTLAHNEQPRLGYIGEVKKCDFATSPAVGQCLVTRLTLLAEIEGVRLIQAETTANDLPVCTCQMKLFLKR